MPEPVDDKQFQKSKKKREERKKISDEVIELNKFALDFWENHLQENNPHSKAAREYLEKREISIETQKTFHIGFAPDSCDALLSHLKEKGADEKLSSKAIRHSRTSGRGRRPINHCVNLSCLYHLER